jgi:hypothetical protein
LAHPKAIWLISKKIIIKRMKLEKKEDEIEKRNKNSIPNFLSNSSLKLNRVEVGST